MRESKVKGLKFAVNSGDGMSM